MNNVRILRLIGLLEGISFLVLLGIAMPLKYGWENESLMNPVGLAHGFLFIGYIVMIVVVGMNRKLGFMFLFWSGLAGFLPFGTFVADSKLFKPLQ